MLAVLARLAVVVSVGVLLLTGVALWLGRLSPSPASFITHNPCALPCVYGVTPGETSVEQARNVVEQLSGGSFSNSPMDGGSLVFQVEQGDVALFGMMSLNVPENTMISAVGLLPVEESDLGRLGDLMAAGLRPTRIYRSCDTTIPLMLIAFGDDSRIVAEMPLRDHLRPETPISFMRIYMDEGDSLSEARLSFGCTVETGWRGFAPSRAYLSAPSL